MKTRLEEKIIVTSELHEMAGKYFAENVKRGWKEDFVDQDTSEVVTINRYERLFDKGKLIDNDALSSINFYLQSGDIKEVKVSEQSRAGELSNFGTSVFCVTVLHKKKKLNYYLYANSIEFALTVISDYLEQKLNGGFSFSAIKEIGYSNLISSIEEGKDNEEVEEEVKNSFYKIEVKIVYEENDEFERVYVVQAPDAEEAKTEIIKYVWSKMQEEEDKRPFETTIISAKTIPCNNIVDIEFVKKYIEHFQEE